MKRIPYIDGLRGYLIYSMTLSHMAFLTPNLFAPLSHKSVSIFFTGEGFMLLSGMMIGYILLGRVQEEGLGPALAVSLRRSGRIALYYLGVYILITLPVIILDQPDLLARVEGYFRGRDPADPWAVFLFVTSLYRPLFFDILYLYIVLIALSPLMIVIALRWGPACLAALSLVVFLVAQYGLTEKFIVLLARAFDADRSTLFGSFSIYAWQFPYVIGLLLGMSIASDWQGWPGRLIWIRTRLMPYALAFCAAFATLRLMTTAGLVSLDYVFLQDYLMVRPMTLINFAAFCVVLVSLLSLRPEEVSGPVTGLLHRTLLALLESRFLRHVGAASLLTFSASVVLTYWVALMQPWLASTGPAVVVNSSVFAAIMVVLFGLAAARRGFRTMRRT